MCSIALFLVIMTAYVMFEKKQKKTDRIVNIDKEKNMKLTACMYIRVMISYVRKYSLCGFRKINTNLLYTLTILIICKEKNT
jgi:peroxiredoxin family protein